jgi:hypothetical protein
MSRQMKLSGVYRSAADDTLTVSRGEGHRLIISHQSFRITGGRRMGRPILFSIGRKGKRAREEYYKKRQKRRARLAP